VLLSVPPVRKNESFSFEAQNCKQILTSCCGVSFCKDAVILNLVRLLENSMLTETIEESSIF